MSCWSKGSSIRRVSEDQIELMAPPKTWVTAAAKPVYGDHFDAWNSSATGHQRAENKIGGSIGWRQSRSFKLSHQLKGGATGGKRVADQVGAGSDDWDEKAKALIPKDVKERARISVADMLRTRNPGTLKIQFYAHRGLTFKQFRKPHTKRPQLIQISGTPSQILQSR
jgi:hypothetical protein